MNNGQLYWNTVKPLLRGVLELLMNAAVLADFRLVGGTALSLQLGHRISVDIDLFSDADYGSIDFDAIDSFLRQSFRYVSVHAVGPIAMGRSYFVGEDANQAVKVDLYYTDSFIRPALIADNVRMATTDEIAAMKMDIVQRAGRKKDFWDIHELLVQYTPMEMIALHKERYPYTHDEAALLVNFTNFSRADEDFEPECLRGKYWEIIRYEIAEAMNG